MFELILFFISRLTTILVDYFLLPRVLENVMTFYLQESFFIVKENQIELQNLKFESFAD